MSNITPSNSDFFRRLSTSTHRRQFELAVTQWEEGAIASSYDEDAMDIDDGIDTAVGEGNGNDEVGTRYQPSEPLVTGSRAFDGASVPRRVGLGSGTSTLKRKKSDDSDGGYNIRANNTTTSSYPPQLSALQSTSNYSHQTNTYSTSSHRRRIKDVTLTPERERSIFYHGSDETPSGQSTGIFSPKFALSSGIKDIPSPSLPKEDLLDGSSK
ncbi:hypothetical protein TWF281_005500 [Arthrobotrys megalospora]